MTQGAMMRPSTLVAALAVLSALMMMDAPAAQAADAVRQPGNFGIGIGAGTLSTGLSLKYFQGDSAIQGNIGIHGRNRYDDWISLGFDYLFEQDSLTGPGDIEVAWNIGPGLSLAVTDDTDYWIFGVSGVVGLEFLFNVVPIDLVLEYRPSVFLFDRDYYHYDWDYRRGDDGVFIDLVNFGAHLRFFF